MVKRTLQIQLLPSCPAPLVDLVRSSGRFDVSPSAPVILSCDVSEVLAADDPMTVPANERVRYILCSRRPALELVLLGERVAFTDVVGPAPDASILETIERLSEVAERQQRGIRVVLPCERPVADEDSVSALRAHVEEKRRAAIRDAARGCDLVARRLQDVGETVAPELAMLRRRLGIAFENVATALAEDSGSMERARTSGET